MMGDGILDKLAQGPVLGDGGYLIELERRTYVKGQYWVPEVVLDNPEALAQLHTEFLRAGSEVLQALTFWTSRNILDDKAGRGVDTERLNRDAVRIAKEAAAGNALVAGTLTTTTLMGSRKHAEALRDTEAEAQLRKVRAVLGEQVAWLAEEGSDLIIAETFDRLDEAVVAVEVAKSADLPVIATMSWRPVDETSTDGFTAGQCARRLSDAGAEVVGFNCRHHPAKILPILREIRSAVDIPLAAQPWAMITQDEGRNEVDPDISEGIQISRADWAKFARDATAMGVRYIGACCGAGPSAIFGLATALGKPTWQSSQ